MYFEEGDFLMAITYDDIKKLPIRVKALIVVGALIALTFAYYSLFLQEALKTKAVLTEKDEKLAAEVAEKERIVAVKPRYLQEVAILKAAFNTALLKLPNKREIPNLLDAVVTSGRQAGVEFLLFEPAPATKRASPAPSKPGKEAKTSRAELEELEKFYDEIPVKVSISGRFHNTLMFFEKVGKLSRIMNIEDISMGEPKDMKGRGYIVRSSCMIKTYMFLEKSQ